jgi:hypothetical protein
VILPRGSEELNLRIAMGGIAIVTGTAVITRF